jgi:hypothetical protein
LYLTPNLNSSPKKQKTKINKKVIVVIIPDFENFAPKVLQDFILIASSYINVLPFVFVFWCSYFSHCRPSVITVPRVFQNQYQSLSFVTFHGLPK